MVEVSLAAARLPLPLLRPFSLSLDQRAALPLLRAFQSRLAGFACRNAERFRRCYLCDCQRSWKAFALPIGLFWAAFEALAPNLPARSGVLAVFLLLLMLSGRIAFR